MQIGTRWLVGGTAPAGLPDAFVAAVTIAEAEQGLADGAWTLTWLEGRPVAEYQDEVRVSLGADGTISTQVGAQLGLDAVDDDDDWLS